MPTGGVRALLACPRRHFGSVRFLPDTGESAGREADRDKPSHGVRRISVERMRMVSRATAGPSEAAPDVPHAAFLQHQKC